MRYDVRMGWLNSQGSKQYRVLYVTPEGREYWFTMSTVIGIDGFAKDPPFVITERVDGIFETCESVYTSLDEFAIEHGCVRGELVSVAPTN